MHRIARRENDRHRDTKSRRRDFVVEHGISTDRKQRDSCDHGSSAETLILFGFAETEDGEHGGKHSKADRQHDPRADRVTERPRDRAEDAAEQADECEGPDSGSTRSSPLRTLAPSPLDTDKQSNQGRGNQALNKLKIHDADLAEIASQVRHAYWIVTRTRTIEQPDLPPPLPHTVKAKTSLPVKPALGW